MRRGTPAGLDCDGKVPTTDGRLPISLRLPIADCRLPMTSSSSLFERSLRVTPGGVHSPVRAFRSVGGSPVFFARGEGARLIDVDGRAYIDFCQAFGPLILGHADPDVSRAVHEAVDDGWSFGACEPYSLDLAEW